MKNKLFVVVILVLAVIFVIINFIDLTPNRHPFEPYDTKSDGGVSLRDAKTSTTKTPVPRNGAEISKTEKKNPAVQTVETLGQRSSAQPRTREKTGEDTSNLTSTFDRLDEAVKSSEKRIGISKHRSPVIYHVDGKNQFNHTNNATNKTDDHDKTLQKTLKKYYKKLKGPSIKTHVDKEIEGKTNESKTPAEDERQKQLQKANPLYSDRVINPHPFHFINNSNGCDRYAPDGRVFLVILVACRPQEDKDRRWIRDTWGSVKAYRGKTLLTRFLVGRAPRKIYTRKMLAEESALYGDLIQENFLDTYHNMTHKVLMGLKWAAQMCPRATYVMNLDSDMFVNVFRLVERLETAPRSNFAEGRLKGVTMPLRKQSRKLIQKWYTPIEMYPESTFPPYLNGPAYVMSGELPGRLFNESAHVRYLPWDDVYIGLVMKKLGVQMAYGDHYEEYPVRWNGIAVLKSISNGIASYVGHQRAYNFVLRDIWGQILKRYDNYVYSPPPDSQIRMNNASLRHW